MMEKATLTRVSKDSHRNIYEFKKEQTVIGPVLEILKDLK